METLVRLAEVPQAKGDEAAQSYGEAEKLDVAPRPKPCDPASIADRLNAIVRNSRAALFATLDHTGEPTAGSPESRLRVVRSHCPPRKRPRRFPTGAFVVSSDEKKP